MRRVIDVVYILNDAYWIPVLVSAKSALLHRAEFAGDNVLIRFDLLVDRVSRGHCDRLQKELSSAVSSVRFVPIDVAMLEELPEWHGSRLIWTRCFLHRILSDIQTWVCICDGDTLWFQDPKRIFDVAESLAEDVVFAGSVDFISKDERSAEWFLERGLVCPESSYGCLGFAALHLGRMGSLEFDKKATEFIRNYGVPTWMEQDVFNHLLLGRKTLLPLGWGASVVRGLRNVNREELAVLHYYGALPWPSTLQRRLFDVHIPWWYVARQILHIPQENGYRMNCWLWCARRCLMWVIQLLPSSLMFGRLRDSVKQVPFDFRSRCREFKRLARLA